MKTITSLSRMIVCTFIMSFSFIFSSIAQTTQVAVIREWVQHFANQDSLMESPSCKDTAGNFYVAGYTLDANTGPDIVIAKYDKDGNLVWSNQYTSSSNYGRDQATGICVDDSQNVYVCGFQMDSTTGTGFDIVTLKYNTTGGPGSWVNVYNGNYSSGLDVPVAIAVNSGLVYVTCTIQDSSGLADIVTLQYDAGGTLQWSAQYDYVNLYDVPRALKANDSRVFITGGSQNTLLDWDYLTLEYSSTGTPVDTVRITNTGNSFDRANAVALTDSGTVYITGRGADTLQGFNIRTVKIDSTGSLIWIRNYNLAGFNDEANAMAVDADENIYITGYGQNGATLPTADYVTLKYDSAGNLLWDRTFSGSGNGKDEAWYVDVDSIGTVYVTGETWNANGNFDFGTIAYDSSGNVLWQDMWDGNYHGNDKATHIEHDGDGIVYVSGQSQTDSAEYEYVTIQYDTKHFISPPDTVPCPSSFAFYGNFGQIIDTDDSVRADIKYYTVHNYPDLYFFKPSENERFNFMSYVFSRVDTDTATADTLHRVDLTFELHQEKTIAASENTKPFSVEKNSQGYLNYFLPQCPNGITGVEGFNKLLYPDVFDYTDILFYGNNAGMKFYIIMKPGADADVGLNFDGQDSITVVGDTVLNIHTSIGTYSYPRPDVFQIDANGDRVDLNWLGEYADWGNGRVGFYMESIDGNLPYVIEVGQTPFTMQAPCIDNLCWSSFYGGASHESFDEMEVDPVNNNFHTGYTRSSLFPIFNASFPFNASPNIDDVVLVKFDSTQRRIFATYFGGNAEDKGTGVAYDNAGNVYLAGHTNSTNMPIRNPGGGTYVDSIWKVGDGFIAKFNRTGDTLLWSTCYGGTGTEGFEEIIINNGINNTGDIYAVGYGDSLSPILNHSGAYVDSINGRGLIVRFDAQGVRQWSTLYGSGIAQGGIRDFTIDPLGNFYVTGLTDDTSFAVVNPGGNAYVDSTYNGGLVDIFIAKFNASDTLVWATLYGGNGHDQGEGVSCSPSAIWSENRFCITGRTTSTDFPIYYSGQYIDSTYGGNTDLYIVRFKENCERQWSTYYGGSEYDEGDAISTDWFGNIFVTGNTRSLDFDTNDPGNVFFQGGIATTAWSDAFITAFRINDSLFWSTYFGGQSFDLIYSVKLDGNETKLYVSGQTHSTYATAPSFPLVDLGGTSWFQPENAQAGFNDCFAARFDISAISTFIDGIAEAKRTDACEFNLFPNPVSDGMFFVTCCDGKSDVTMTIYNSIMQKVYARKITRGEAASTFEIKMPELGEGIYFVQFITKHCTGAKKIIIQK